MNFDLSTSELGKETNYEYRYNPDLLFRIPRAENREKYNIASDSLSFVGFDVWNCYEVSFLTLNGLPVSRMLKLVIPSNSEFIVESKSLKLYLFSFNMERISDTVENSEKKVLSIIKADLEKIVGAEIMLDFLNDSSAEKVAFESFNGCSLVNQVGEDLATKYQFSHFKEASELLLAIPAAEPQKIKFSCDLLRSNCRVTNQPDWGELFVEMESNFTVDLMGFLSYIVSFREENHFHEEVVEMIYKRLLDKFTPAKLMVAATYTRRGGIDINPIRATHLNLIDPVAIDTKIRMKKTYRQ